MGHQQIRGRRVRWRYLFPWLLTCRVSTKVCVPRLEVLAKPLSGGPEPSLSLDPSSPGLTIALPTCPQRYHIVPVFSAPCTLFCRQSLHGTSLELPSLGVSSVSCRTSTGTSAKDVNQPDTGTGYIKCLFRSLQKQFS